MTMAITDANKEPLKNRLAKAIGHLHSVQRMVDEKRYCIDVLNQLKAVQAALDKTAEVMLKQHLETCVVEAIRNQETDRVVEELMQVFRKAPELDFSLDTDAQKESASTRTADTGCCH